MNKLEHALIQKYHYTRSRTLYLIKNHMVAVNGAIVTDRSYITKNTDEIVVQIPTLTCKIIWRNEEIAIVHKPHGMPVERCATTAFTDVVLEENVAQQLCLERVFALHRLDKETNGIMIVALNKDSYEKYKPMMRERKFTKAYKAFYANEGFRMNAINHFECPHGKLIWSSETNCLCNKICEYTLKKIRINETSKGIKIAENGTKICETLIKSIHNGYDCILVTGRTHQIRLTMKNMKQVIAGDKLYGSRDSCDMQLFAYYIDIDINLIFV